MHVTKEFVDDFASLLKQHNVQSVEVANVVGQALEQVEKSDIHNAIPWMLRGMAFSYVTRNDVISTLQNVVKNVEGNPLNYNDLDCTLWGKYSEGRKECLECSSWTAKLMGKPKQDTATCPRCKGTNIDPDYKDKIWTVVYDDHGNGLVYVVIESCIDFELHIRELPYNKSDKSRVMVMNKISKAVSKEEGDYGLIRYKDSRDTGFVLSLTWKKDLSHHSGEANLRAPYTLTTVAEHFTTLFKEV